MGKVFLESAGKYGSLHPQQTKSESKTQFQHEWEQYAGEFYSCNFMHVGSFLESMPGQDNEAYDSSWIKACIKIKPKTTVDYKPILY